MTSTVGPGNFSEPAPAFSDAFPIPMRPRGCRQAGMDFEAGWPKIWKALSPDGDAPALEQVLSPAKSAAYWSCSL